MDHPRYGALSWMVRFFVMEPSTISVSSVEGSVLETEPSVIRASSVEGSYQYHRTVREIDLQRGRFREQDGGREGGFCHARPSIPGNDERECLTGKAEDWKTAGNVLN